MQGWTDVKVEIMMQMKLGLPLPLSFLHSRQSSVVTWNNEIEATGPIGLFGKSKGTANSEAACLKTLVFYISANPRLT